MQNLAKNWMINLAFLREAVIIYIVGRERYKRSFFHTFLLGKKEDSYIMIDQKARMKELIELLNQANEAYYARDEEIMSNYEYDRLYDELIQLEEQTGTVLSDSPTTKVGYEAVDDLPKEAHEKPMLSLGKTKDREELRTWLNGREGLLSWKLDGLTIVLTYRNGELVKGVTRGNGEIGEVVTNNVRVFKNVPLKIPYQGELIIRGEAVITYSDFEKINRQLKDTDVQYKNPRNLCSGSVRQLNNEVTAQRNVRFYAFSLVKADDVDFKNSFEQQFLFLKEQGFSVVEYRKVREETILDAISWFEHQIEGNDIPSDGLVLSLEDLAYGESLGRTAKFPRNAIAFKWADEIRETTLLKIEWSPSRTGLINPVAVFEPVELEGTTVSRASVHNVSIMKELKLGIGDKITVYKANMIIPQIAENLTCSANMPIPDTCPVCGGRTEIRQLNDTESLYCINPECEAKKIKSFSHFVARDAMNIDGLSEATLEKLIGLGLIHEFADIYRLSEHKDVIVEMEGFGEKSYNNLIESIEKTRKTTLPRLINALGIPGIGLANAKVIAKEWEYDIEALRNVSEEALSEVEGIGDVLAHSFCEYMADTANKERLDHLLMEVIIEKPKTGTEEQTLAKKVFVITGDLVHFSNRNELKEVIESKGGKVTGSVTSKTTCLINNDIMSTSGKNRKAKELGIPIISEEEFIKTYLE